METILIGVAGQADRTTSTSKAYRYSVTPRARFGNFRIIYRPPRMSRSAIRRRTPGVVVKVSVVIARSGRTQAEGSTAAIALPRSMHPSTATSA